MLTIIAVVWQVMRYHMISILRGLRGGSHKQDVSDVDILNWANNKIVSAGKKNHIKDFKDPNLKDGVYLIDLLFAIEPSCIDYSLVTKGETENDRMMNAKYAISVARQLGCCMFILWEDLVEVKPKMILAFLATLMSAFPN
jgi:plastin-1